MKKYSLLWIAEDWGNGTEKEITKEFDKLSTLELYRDRLEKNDTIANIRTERNY